MKIISNQENSYCFTGHRDIPVNEYPSIEKRLDSELRRLVHQGVKYFYTGGARGFDTLAALAVLQLKKECGDIRLILVLPCKNQTLYWNENDKKIYGQILNEADEAVYTSEHYSSGCMHIRNRYLVDKSAYYVCYLTKTTGGTAYTAGYAAKMGLRVVNLAEC